MSGDAKSKGLYITRLENFDMGELGIRLSNDNFIVLEIKHILALPGFEVLAENERFFYPLKSEDGSAIYWRDGPRPISVDEILSLVGKTDGENDSN